MFAWYWRNASAEKPFPYNAQTFLAGQSYTVMEHIPIIRPAVTQENPRLKPKPEWFLWFIVIGWAAFIMILKYLNSTSGS